MHLKKLFSLLVSLMVVSSAVAQLNLKDLTDGKYRPVSPDGVNPMADGESYARIEDDKRIVEAATDLYEKFCNFAETFERIGAQLQTAQKSYDQAKSQLNGGRGNIIRRLDALQNMGVTTGKHIPNKLKEE